ALPERVLLGFTGEEVQLRIPDDGSVCSIAVDLAGADGGDGETGSTDAPGGAGGSIAAEVPVAPGDVVTFVIGGRGEDGGWEASDRALGGFGGGGAGGITDAETTHAAAGGGGASWAAIAGVPVVVAGGGGHGGLPVGPGRHR